MVTAPGFPHGDLVRLEFQEACTRRTVEPKLVNLDSKIGGAETLEEKAGRSYATSFLPRSAHHSNRSLQRACAWVQIYRHEASHSFRVSFEKAISSSTKISRSDREFS